jgi:hypothetical protein
LTFDAVAFDVSAVETHDLLGVALIVAAARHISFLRVDGDSVERPEVSSETWHLIDEAMAEIAARLPFKPPPAAPVVAEALFAGRAHAPVLVERFASIPVTVDSDGSLAPRLEQVLPALLGHRRSAA